MKNLLATLTALLLCSAAHSEVQTGDHARYKTHAEITIFGQTKTEDATVDKTIVQMKSADDITVREIKKGTLEHYDKNTSETLMSLVSADKNEFQSSPQEIISNCEKLNGGKRTTIKWHSQSLDACEIYDGTPEHYLRRVYADVPLYLFDYEYLEVTEQGKIKVLIQLQN